MTAEDKNSRLFSLSYNSLLILLIATPLVFLTQIENVFSLAKKSSVIITGGLFIISSAVYFLLKIVSEKKTNHTVLVDRKIDPAILLFIISAFLSAILSIKPFVSYLGQYQRQIGFVLYLYFFLVYFISSQIFKNREKTNTVVKGMVYVSFVVALYAMIQYLRFDPFETPLIGGIRPVSTLGHSTFAGGFMVMVFPLSLVLVFTKEKPYKEIIISVVILTGIIINQTRAAYAAVMIVLIIMFIAYPYLYKQSDKAKFRKLLRQNLAIVVIIGLILLLLVILFPENPFIARLLRLTDIFHSARWLLWRDSIEAFRVHPFFGSGIGTFPSVFEFFLSYDLKALEPKSYFDNAHNIFIHTLVTTGIAGLAAFVFLLLRGFITAAKGFLNSVAERKSRILFLGIFSAFAGYTVYSLVDFEDISILLYLFVLFAVLKSLYSRYSNTQLFGNNIKLKNSAIYSCAFIAVISVLFCFYNFYYSYTELSADSLYREAKIFYAKGDFKNAVTNLNKAVTLNPVCGEYKFTLASYVNDYCLKNSGMNKETKDNLLYQAEQELERAKINFFSHLQCKALLTVIKLQQDNFEEADKLKREVFKEDSLLLFFRNNLARYYFSKDDSAKVINEVSSVFWIDRYNSDATIILASYYSSKGYKQEALKVCAHYLEKYPLDPYVLNLQDRINSLP